MRDKVSGLLMWLTRPFTRRDDSTRYIIGEISYDNDYTSTLTVPPRDQVFQVEIAPQIPVRGLHIPSHRPVYNYQPVGSIPTLPITRQQAFNDYVSLIKQRYLNSSGGRNANVVIKETLISLATFGYGNEVVRASPQARTLFEEFQLILKQVLPPQLGFQRLSIEIPEVLLVTKSGRFPLDGVSGGIASIIDMAWQIFMYYENDRSNFVVTIDEPENHLHPAMQQTVLPGFLNAFPHAQFVVATHNPFIINSVLHSSVYVMSFNEQHRVTSKSLDFVNKAGTANDILREVLGVPFTIPIWAERRLSDVIARYSEAPIDENSVEQLRGELKQIGLEKLIPDAITKVIRQQPKDD